MAASSSRTPTTPNAVTRPTASSARTSSSCLPVVNIRWRHDPPNNCPPNRGNFTPRGTARTRVALCPIFGLWGAALRSMADES